MKINIWVVAFGILFFGMKGQDAFAQKSSLTENNTTGTRSGLYLGGQATTNGMGFNLRYIFSKRITLKTGIESLNLNRSFLYEEKDISYNAELNYKTGGLFFLADFFYTRSLYFSGGLMVNNFQPRLEGAATSSLQYGDITIPASKVGRFNFHFEPELKLSPYMGLGFRKFIGKKEMITYNFETGLYYMGQPNVNIETTGLLAPTSDPAHKKKEYLEEQFSAYKFYPVVKFAIGIRLF